MPSKSTSPQIHFFHTDQRFKLPERTALKLNIQTVFRKEGFKLASLNYIFCSDEYLLDINKSYLNHDFYTDIITFDLSDGSAITGEIYISIDRVRDNAKTLKLQFINELHRVILHGALHLCGYTDKTKKDQAVMRSKEDHYLSLIKGKGNL